MLAQLLSLLWAADIKQLLLILFDKDTQEKVVGTEYGLIQLN